MDTVRNIFSSAGDMGATAAGKVWDYSGAQGLVNRFWPAGNITISVPQGEFAVKETILPVQDLTETVESAVQEAVQEVAEPTIIIPQVVEAEGSVIRAVGLVALAVGALGFAYKGSQIIYAKGKELIRDAKLAKIHNWQDWSNKTLYSSNKFIKFISWLFSVITAGLVPLSVFVVAKSRDAHQRRAIEQKV